jgi:hypothetical protein
MPKHKILTIALIAILSFHSHFAQAGFRRIVLELDQCEKMKQENKKIAEIIDSGFKWENSIYQKALDDGSTMNQACEKYNANPTQQGAADLLPLRNKFLNSSAAAKNTKKPLGDKMSELISAMEKMGNNSTCYQKMKSSHSNLMSDFPESQIAATIKSCKK